MRPVLETERIEDRTAMNWEAFYKNYRKPDYIPGYEIISKLGGGVFGVVFKARKHSIGKFYAVKFLKVEDDRIKDAVLRELEGLRFFAQIDHPNLVSIEDKGEVDGIPFIVMGYAGDETLKRRLETRPIDVDETLRIFRQVCQGVQALHEKSIVHFDLKPGNVFLKGGLARVGDYGLSRLMSESRNTLSFGRGTPYYMAPEMIRNRGDKRSDVYSLGVMLFESLTGDVPFRGDSEWEVLKKHEVEPVRFPEAVPEALRSILARCLAKEPEERFATVRDLLDALPASAGEATVDAIDEAGRRSRRRRKRGGGVVSGASGTRASGTSDAGATEERHGAGVPAAEASSSGGSSRPTQRSSRFNPLGRLTAPILGTIAVVLERLAFALRQADDAIEHLSDPKSEGRPARRAVPPAEIYGRFFRGSLIGGVFRILGMSIDLSLLAVFTPIKFVFVVLGRTLDYLVKVPFRLLGVGVKLLVVVAGFYALFLFVRFLLPLSLGILFRFH